MRPRLWRALFGPSPTITDPFARSQAQLLSIVLLPYILLTCITLAGFLIYQRATPDTRPAQGVLIVCIVVYIVAYALSRTRRFKAGALLFCVTSALASLGAALLYSEHAYQVRTALDWLTVTAAVASVMLSTRTLILLVLGQIAGAFTVLMVSPGITVLHALPTAQYLLVSCGLAAVGAVLRARAERAVAEQQMALLSASKFSAVGEMAAGIAHEINNPLTAIVMEAEELGRQVEEGSASATRVREAARKIDDVAMRISRIIRGLRAMARESGGDPFERVPVRVLVDDTLVFCAERFRTHGVRVDTEIPSGLGLSCRPGQISQVLLNLLNNSYDALEPASERWILISADSDGEYVRLAVTDSGTGIAPSFRGRLFQPFATTKPPGKGTGLGLCISRGIVESHHGTLELDSHSARTRFVASLPVNPGRV